MVSRRGGGGRRHRAPAVDETGKGDHDMGQETNTQAVRYAEAVADDDMLHEDDLRRMRDEYCERRKLSGTVAADAQWADEPFDHWLAGLSAQPGGTRSMPARRSRGPSMTPRSPRWWWE